MIAIKKRICIISFSPILRDARVLRQIEYLSPHYDLSVIGYGEPGSPWPGVQWTPVAVTSNARTRATGMLLMLAGRLLPRLYDRWYWQKAHHRRALELAVQSRASAYLANDWNALPVAAEAARRAGGRVVLDAHEYAPLEYEDRLYWRLFYATLVVHFLRKYVSRIDASMTVAWEIADRYRQEFGLSPVVVLNAPKPVPVPGHSVDPSSIRLVHHGAAAPDRGIESMVESLARADKRFSLHFFLVGSQPEYMQKLEKLSRERAPGRITFHEPVPPAEIVARISEYDTGFYLLKPTSFNNGAALPNKLFDFLAAGLAVCVGPAPGMARLVTQYGCGCVAPSFDPEEVARTLDGLAVGEIEAMRASARQAALELNADRELAKVVQLFKELFGEE